MPLPDLPRGYGLQDNMLGPSQSGRTFIDKVL
jgi:hypothetical protein